MESSVNIKMSTKTSIQQALCLNNVEIITELNYSYNMH